LGVVLRMKRMVRMVRMVRGVKQMGLDLEERETEEDSHGLDDTGIMLVSLALMLMP
jgi:hypothetical protein